MKKKIVAIVIFLVIIFVPTLFWPLLNKLDKTEINENRELAPYPTKFSDDYFVKFDDYYLDHLPLRKAMIKLYSEIELKFAEAYKKMLSKTGEDYFFAKNNAIQGENDWLFYQGDNSVNYYNGTNLPNLTELQNMIEKAEIVNNYFKSQGKRFIIFIAPNKEQIYSEYMPNGIHVLSQKKRLDLMYDYFTEKSSVPFVYPKQALLQAKGDHQLYYKRDTHWSKAGAYIGFCELMKVLNMNPMPATFFEVPRLIGDLANMMAQTNIPDIDYHAVYRQDNVCEMLTEPADLGYRVDVSIRSTSNSENKNKIAIFGDSFRENMADYICKEFSTSFITHRDAFGYNDALFEKEIEESNIVVFMAVERNENNIFGDNGFLDRFIKCYGLE